MSQENVEIVGGIYARWARGDFRTEEVFDPDVLFVIRPEFPDAGTYLGVDRAAEYTRGFLEPWTQIAIAAEEITAAGDSVVVAVLQSGVGRGSGAATDFRYFHIWTFRGPRVIRWEIVRDRATAMEAVGLVA